MLWNSFTFRDGIECMRACVRMSDVCTHLTLKWFMPMVWARCSKGKTHRVG